MSYHDDADFISESNDEARLDQMHDLQEMAQERGFESIAEMTEFDKMTYDDN